MEADAWVTGVHSYAAGAWRRSGPLYDMGHGRILPFLELTLDEQARIVARLAWLKSA